MRDEFKYDETIENKTEYLSKAAIWLDIIMNGTGYLDSVSELVSEMDVNDMQAIKDYVFSVMKEDIFHIGMFYVKKWNLYKYKDTFLNYYGMIVFSNLFRFNNPNYLEEEKSYSFNTFAKNYVKDALKTVLQEDNGHSKRQEDYHRAVRKTMEYVSKLLYVDSSELTADDIMDYLPLFTKRPMSREIVTQVMKRMSPKVSLDELENTLSKEGYNDEYAIRDSVVEEDVHNFIGALRPLERFIILQNYGYCSREFKGLTAAELAEQKDFVKLCSADKKANKRVEAGTLNEKFVTNEREYLRRKLRKCFEEREYTYDDLLGYMDEICISEWNSLASDYLKSVLE